MDLQYRISGVVVSDSTGLASSPPPSDSILLRSESGIFATMARGSCGVDPRPERFRIETFSESLMGDWPYGER